MCKYDFLLDVQGLKCPAPLLKARQRLKSLNLGETLCVISTDSNSILDFAALSKQTGDKLLKQWQAEGKYYFILQSNTRQYKGN